MTGSKVLVVKLPERNADVKQLEAFRAYVCDALGTGTLVLPLGTTYAVEDFPALGAPEWQTGAPPKVGEYYCRFDCGDIDLYQIATWNRILERWQFGHGVKIDTPCLGWWPLPARASAKEGA